MVDPRYLTLHPATALWWTQRGQCEGCIHMCRTTPEAMTCTVTRAASRSGYAPCIDARAEGAPCGPEAKLWVPHDDSD